MAEFLLGMRVLNTSMRVIAGQWKKQKLDLPPREYARPTKDRVKESLFNIIESKLLREFEEPISWSDILFIDGFSGSGSIGIEALSRGAGHIFFIENNREVMSVLNRNVSFLKPKPEQKNISLFQDFKNMPDIVEFVKKENIQFGYFIIFLDPPYKQDLEKMAFECLKSKGYLSQKGFLILEESSDYVYSDILSDLYLKDQRSFGQSQLLLFEF